jgi:concentrative nucleoside transporter, CNT family
MTCGMAGVAGTVVVIYAGFLAPIIQNALGNILIASVISTPAALAVAAIMVPFPSPEPGAAPR